MGLLVLYLFLYLISIPLIIFGIKSIQNYTKRQIQRKMRLKPTPEDPSKQWDKKLYKSINFTIKQDTRASKVTVSHQIMFFIIYGVGLVISLLTYFNFVFLLIALFIQIIAWIYSVQTSKDILSTRDKIFSRMNENKVSFIGDTKTPNDFVITAWKDFVTPVKIEMAIPSTKDQLAVNSFLANFNAVFGNDSPWVPDMMHPQHKGYDMNAGIFTIVAIDPLPLKADWNAHYVLNENIAWNFFPIAIGSQGGVPLDIDGKTVRVLGFATGGEQLKMVQKRGLPTTPDLAYAPQILIAGPTGGGKALALDTEIPIVTN